RREPYFILPFRDFRRAPAGAKCAQQGQRICFKRNRPLLTVESYRDHRAVVCKNLGQERHVGFLRAKEGGERLGLIKGKWLGWVRFPELRQQLLEVSGPSLQHNEP